MRWEGLVEAVKSTQRLSPTLLQLLMLPLLSLRSFPGPCHVRMMRARN